MSLYLKYRPQDFNSVVGQEHVITTLKNAQKHNALTHAYLFAGPRGTGKTSIARILAKAIMTQGLEDETLKAEILSEIEKGNIVDLIEIDAASNRGIDEMRQLREKIVFAPTRAKSKVYIVDEVHMLTKEAFNALLKTLEEPPEHAYFVLATTEVHKIPETIISRCQLFNFKRIGLDDIKKRLESIAIKEGIRTEAEALELIARTANGGLRDAIGLLEQMNAEGEVTHKHVASGLGLTGIAMIESFFSALIEKKAQEGLDLINKINAQGKNLNQFTEEFIRFLREQMLINIGNKLQLNAILNLIEIFSEAKPRISQSFIPQLPLEVATIKACHTEEAQAEPKKSFLKKAKEEVAIKANEKKVVEPPKTEKTKSDPVENAKEINLEEVKKNWGQIAEKIKTPFIRISWMDGEPIKIEKNELHISFKSKSLMEKVGNKNNEAEIQKAFEQIFQQKIKLSLSLKELNLVSVDKGAEKKEEVNVTDMAKEVFGS